MSAQPAPRTLGELRRSGYARRSVREEIRSNVIRRLRAGEKLFSGIIGYEDTVVPAVENALLCGHDMIFLGERGQAKTRMIRALAELLDEWLPAIANTETRDEPEAPVSAQGRALVASHGDATPIEWIHRDARYVEKLATPDVSVADLIGDVDPIKVAEGRSLGDELTMHFGLLPRANRGVFCINELPDLSEKVQVALFNVMEERDLQIKGYQVRLPLDVLVVASANPEDYTSRGRIITPLKDRYGSQVRTHYPATRELELRIVDQEAELPAVEGVEVTVPEFMRNLSAEITFQARSSPDVSQLSGVSVRMSIASYEILVASSIRRALRLGETRAVPRISDLDALATSILGKLELEYSGDGSPVDVVSELTKRATRVVFEEIADPDELSSIVDAFDSGWNVEVSAEMPSEDYIVGLDQIPGLEQWARKVAGGDSPAALASAIEFLLDGLHSCNRLNKKQVDGSLQYGAR